MYKSCPYCGRIHAVGYRCASRTKTSRNDEESKLRNKYAWAKKSKEVREKANFLCEVCKDQNVFTYDNLEVHHIVKLKADSTRLLDDMNLICLCQMHHKQADAHQIDQDYLFSLARKREDAEV